MGAMDAGKIDLGESWNIALRDEFPKPWMAELCEFIETEYRRTKEIYPPKPEIFAALDLTHFDKVRVIIIGQDPYHRRGQAHGLCFSYRGEKPLPPSLQAIFKEVSSESYSAIPESGDLTRWAKQGVLLLNMALTVEGKAGAHLAKWKCFTNAIINTLAAKKEHLVFISWGKKAQEAVQQIDETKHLVLDRKSVV